MNKLEKSIKYAMKYGIRIDLKYNNVGIAALYPHKHYKSSIAESYERDYSIECRGKNKNTKKFVYLLSYQDINLLVDEWYEE